MKKNLKIITVLALIAPLFAFAATLDSLVVKITKTLSTIIPLLVILAVIYFIWGVIQYTLSTNDEAKKGARGKVIQGLIGLFVIISFWGLVGIISQTFELGDHAGTLETKKLPCLEGYCNNN